MAAGKKLTIILAATSCLVLAGFGIGATLANSLSTSDRGSHLEPTSSVAQLGIQLSEAPNALTGKPITNTGATTTSASPVPVKDPRADQGREEKAEGYGQPSQQPSPGVAGNPRPAPRLSAPSAPASPPPPPAPAPVVPPPVVNAIPYAPIPASPFEVDGNTIKFN